MHLPDSTPTIAAVAVAIEADPKAPWSNTARTIAMGMTHKRNALLALIVSGQPPQEAEHQ
jgi:hypothetical protein